MKRIAFFLPTLLVLVLVLGAVWLNGVETPPQPADRLEDKGIVLLTSTVPVEQKIQRRALELLSEDAPTRSVFVYAITNLDHKDGYYYASVAGLPIGSDRMSLQDAIWLGMVTIGDSPDLPGTVDELMGSQPASPDGLGRGGSQNILPFRDGTTATYGVLGVHNCGFQLNGWKAVDLFPSENMVYAANEGQVSYVCRDTHQVALRIGDYLYTHLVDTGQATGDQYAQGQAISGMVPGTYDDTCGYADQQAEHYHVHFCFLPNPAGAWAADGYAINVNQGYWVKGEETVEPLGTLTADWANAGVSPPGAASTVGGNFWDGLISGVMDLVAPTMEKLPEHQGMDISSRVTSTMATPLRLLYLVILVNFDMRVVMWVVGIITVLEAVRLIYAAWMWVKRAIPVVG